MRRLGVLLATVLAVLAPALPASAITYGVADSNDHPNVGGLVSPTQYSDGTWIYCSGTLISPTIFLTAAHCADDGERVAVTFDTEAGDEDKRARVPEEREQRRIEESSRVTLAADVALGAADCVAAPVPSPSPELARSRYRIAIHNMAFKKSPLGKRGYDEEEVDGFLDEVEQKLIRLLEENEALRGRMQHAGAGGAGPMAAAMAIKAEFSAVADQLERVQRARARAAAGPALACHGDDGAFPLAPAPTEPG